MADQLKNFIIGLFVVAALGIVMFILLFLHPSIGDERQVLHVRFADLEKVNVGTRVTFAGRPVGEVYQINDIENGREGPHDDYGHVYVYEVTLHIDSGIIVYDIDEISLRTAGLLGERSVAIMPMAAKPGQIPRRVTKEEILYAQELGSVEDAVREFKQVADKLDIVLDSAAQTLDDIHKEELVQHIAAVAENLSDITGALNKPDEWSAIVTNMQEVTAEVVERLPASWDTVDSTLAELHKSSSNVHTITDDAKKVVAHLGRGEGTLGRLFMRDDLYLSARSVMSKVETVADDVNHYGLLFTSDKGWQRLRARRLNLMNRLSSPQEFRNYFNDELDQITTSLSRVSMVLDKTDSCCNGMYYRLLDDPLYSKVFAELLRRVHTMVESLELYNQQVMESDVIEQPGCVQCFEPCY